MYLDLPNLIAKINIRHNPFGETGINVETKCDTI